MIGTSNAGMTDVARFLTIGAIFHRFGQLHARCRPAELADDAEAVARVRGDSVNQLIIDGLAAEIERVRQAAALFATSVDPEVHERVVSAAGRDGVSVSAWMAEAARRSLVVRDGLEQC